MSRVSALFVAVLLAALPAASAERRFALVIGEAKGGAGTRPLRYAERDAKRVHGIFTRLGGVREDDALLLNGASASDVRKALDKLHARLERARAAGDQTVLMVYYSGHA